jgi:sec-independent protein translocase protein TatA
MRIGLGEIIVLVFVVVLVFSASRMGQLGNALGKFVYSFKKASRGEDFVDVGPSKQRLSKRTGKSQPEDAQIIDGEKRSR